MQMAGVLNLPPPTQSPTDKHEYRQLELANGLRVMLVSNLAVEQRFANGTQGRLMYWNPPSAEKGKVLYSSRPELLARFVKESALNKRESSSQMLTILMSLLGKKRWQHSQGSRLSYSSRSSRAMR